MQISTIVVRHIFTYGNLCDTHEIFVRILSCPEIRELTRMAGLPGVKGPKHWSSIEAVISNVKNYLNQILESKGSRNALDQQAYRTVLAACTGTNLVDSKTLCYVAGLLVSVVLLFLLSIIF